MIKILGKRLNNTTVGAQPTFPNCASTFPALPGLTVMAAHHYLTVE